MKLNTQALIQYLRIVGAVIVIFVGGFWNLIITFSDYPHSWSQLVWFLYLLAWHALIAFLVGFLIPSAWYLAILTALGSLGLYRYPNILYPLLASVIAVGFLGARVSIWRDPEDHV